MRRSFLLLLFALPVFCMGQWYVEPVVGYQWDANKTGVKQLNTALQFSYKTGKHHELIFQLQRSWLLSSATGFDSAFSLNPALPLYAAANKKISPSAISLAIGHRFKVWGANKPHTVSLLLFTGVRYERIKVRYDYDKNNYTILNPDRTISRTGIYLGFGVEYMYDFKKGRLFTQFVSATPPLRGLNYPVSFKLVAPVYISIGYSIPLKSSTNEKK